MPQWRRSSRAFSPAECRYVRQQTVGPLAGAQTHRMAPASNRLIDMLPRPAQRRLLALCEPVDLVLSQTLCEPGTITQHAYFPTEGFISLLALSNEHAALEVGMVGREGMLGVQLVLNVQSVPLRALVQGPGQAWRIGQAPFRIELAKSAALQSLMHRYVYVLMAQLAAAAGCLRFHLIGPRLARWLLMSQDRAQLDSFRVTHEFLAYMLGVRRVGITGAAGALQRAGLIAYRRGQLTVLDRPGLEAAACSCYSADRRVYRQVFGA
jgi:CRP-like cAMP-binding protein